MILTKTEIDWETRLNTSCARVESWLSGIPDEHWLDPIEGGWTIKDLIGHLAAWSNLLLNQIEALAQGNPDAIKQIDIDSWNAAQIAVRRDWSIAKIRKQWQQSSQRAQKIVAKLPAEAFGHRWQVAWAKEPVKIKDLLDLWLLHLRQHQEAWEPGTKT